MADKYLNLSGLQAFYDELKSHYPTTGLKTFKSFDYGFTNGGAEFIDGTISASTSASTFGIYTLTNNLALSNTGNNLYISAKPYPTTATSASTAGSIITEPWTADATRYLLFCSAATSTNVGYDGDLTYNPNKNLLKASGISATNVTANGLTANSFTGKQLVTVLATACTTAVTANTKDSVNALSNPKIGFYDTDATQKGYILWTDYNNTNTWVNADSAFFGGTSITDGFVVTSDQLNSIMVTKNLSATNFKANTISATTVSANLSGWSRSALSANYSDNTRALKPYEYSKNGAEPTEWLKIGTFHSNNNNAAHAGIEFILNMRDNGGQDGTYLIYVQQGEWDGNISAANPNWQTVTLTLVDGRSNLPTNFTLGYINTGSFGTNGGIVLYAKLSGFTNFTIRALSWNYDPIPFDFDMSTKTNTEPTGINYVTPSRFTKSTSYYESMSAGSAKSAYSAQYAYSAQFANKGNWVEKNDNRDYVVGFALDQQFNWNSNLRYNPSSHKLSLSGTVVADKFNGISEKEYTSITNGTSKATNDTRWMWVCRLKGCSSNSYQHISILLNNSFWNIQHANSILLTFMYGRNGGQGDTVSLYCGRVSLLQRCSDLEFKTVKNPSSTIADNTVDVYIRVSNNGNSYGHWAAKVLNHGDNVISNLVEWKWQFNQTLPTGAEDIPLTGWVNYATSAQYAQNVAGNYVKALSNQNLTLATARSTGDMIAQGTIYLVY